MLPLGTTFRLGCKYRCFGVDEWSFVPLSKDASTAFAWLGDPWDPFAGRYE